MALKKEYAYNGLTVQDAYIKITRVDLDNLEIRIRYSVFANQESRTSGIFPITGGFLVIPFAEVMSGSNPIQMCYDAMKALPEFTDAVDC